MSLWVSTRSTIGRKADIAVPPALLFGGLGSLLLRVDRYLQILRQLLLHEATCFVDNLSTFPRRRRSHLHCFAACTRHPHARGPLGRWRHRKCQSHTQLTLEALRHRFLCHWLCHPFCFLCQDLRRREPLHRRPVLLHALHVAKRDDGVQVLGLYVLSI